MSKSKKVAFEENIFTWEDVDIVDTQCAQFEGCTLTVDVGPYKAGDRVFSITLDYETGRLEFWDETGFNFLKGKIIPSVVDVKSRKKKS